MKQVFLSAMQTQERHYPCSRLRCKFFPRLCQFFQPQIYLGNVTQRRRVKKRFLHLQCQKTQETLRIEWDFRSVCELDPRMVTPLLLPAHTTAILRISACAFYNKGIITLFMTTVNSLYCGHPRESVIAGIYFSQTTVIYFFLGI